MLWHPRNLLVAAALAVATPGAPALAQEQPPEGSVPLTAVELLQIWGNRTWRWGDNGGAYFDKADGRPFRAYIGEGENRGSAKGKWRITDLGNLCYEAEWTAESGVYPLNACLAHMAAPNGDIYQRSLPDGAWFIFKHATPEPADEFSKLVREDLVSANMPASE